jgi:hypothetical protein
MRLGKNAADSKTNSLLFSEWRRGQTFGFSGVPTFLHIGAQESIDPGLIAWSLPPIPFEHIAIDSYGELPFPRYRL